MDEIDAQLDRRRNREQWYALVHHLLAAGYSVSKVEGVNTLFSPQGKPIMTLPDSFQP
jgi:hypothetical protein